MEETCTVKVVTEVLQMSYINLLQTGDRKSQMGGAYANNLLSLYPLFDSKLVLCV